MKKKIRVKTPKGLQTPQSRRYFAVILSVLLGIFISIAIKQNDQPELLTSVREDELVLILDDLSKQKDALEIELLKQSQILDSYLFLFYRFFLDISLNLFINQRNFV
jgi:hypothetical protein